MSHILCSVSCSIVYMFFLSKTMNHLSNLSVRILDWCSCIFLWKYILINFFWFFRDRDHHLKTFKSVVPASKLVDWLLLQVKWNKIKLTQCMLHYKSSSWLQKNTEIISGSVYWMKRCKQALCLSCVRHWLGFPGRLLDPRGCCDARRWALQQWLHAPRSVQFSGTCIHG